MPKHKAGFVNIIGYPNVGKSTLMNALLGEKISIVTPKVQTTRHRILGIMTEKQYQIVFSDTPGILEPKYELQKSMLSYIEGSLEDADIILYLIEPADEPEKHNNYLKKISNLKIPFYLVINKIDLAKNQNNLEAVLDKWKKVINTDQIIPISALYDFNLKKILYEIIKSLPYHPPYYTDERITDKSERFIASEIIREKIFLKYRQEIPYSTEVLITSFKDEDILRITAEIFVNRKSQKPILIGKGGFALKEIGVNSRKDLEIFFDKQVYLELRVKVRENWRNKAIFLKQFGYIN